MVNEGPGRKKIGKVEGNKSGLKNQEPSMKLPKKLCIVESKEMHVSGHCILHYMIFLLPHSLKTSCTSPLRRILRS